MKETKKLISDFYAKKADEEMDRLWEAGIINEQKLEEWLNGHDRVSTEKLAVGA